MSTISAHSSESVRKFYVSTTLKHQWISFK
jgi:hypothetical protein